MKEPSIARHPQLEVSTKQLHFHEWLSLDKGNVLYYRFLAKYEYLFHLLQLPAISFCLTATHDRKSLNRCKTGKSFLFAASKHGCESDISKNQENNERNLVTI